MPVIRTLVVDDSPLFLFTIVRFLELIPNLTVVGSAASGVEALEQANRLRPDLVVLDLEMPQMNGLVAARLLKAREDAPYIIMLSMHGDSAYRALAAEAKADIFVAKKDADTELVPAIERLFAL